MTAHTVLAVRLPPMQRWAVYLVLTAAGSTGLAWTVLHDLLQLGWMLSERRLLIAHGVASALALVVVGGLVPLHIRLGLKTNRNTASGLTTLGLFAVLGLTGLMLYYGGEDWREGVRWSHIIIGAVACLGIPAHIWLGLRLAKRSRLNQESKLRTMAPDQLDPLGQRNRITLAQTALHTEYQVSEVTAPPGATAWKSQLEDIGFLPGEHVAVMARGMPGSDPLVVKVGLSTFALRTAEASCIYVTAVTAPVA